MLPVIAGIARAGTAALRGVATGIGATARVAVSGTVAGVKAIGRGVAAGAKGASKTVSKLFDSNRSRENDENSDDSNASAEAPDGINITARAEPVSNAADAEAIENTSVDILKSIAYQINILRKNIEQYETELFKKEQVAEAADIEKKIESKDATKIETKGLPGKDKKSEGLIQKLLGGLLFTVFAFLPPILKFFKDSKATISALPTKIIDSFKGIIDSISGVIKEYVVDPISKFFKVDVGAALDTLFIFIGDKLEAIMDVPKRLLNAASLFSNNLITDAVQKFVDVVNHIVTNNPILKRLGIVESTLKSANDKLIDLKNKKKQLEQEKGALEERKAAREKATISDTFGKQRAIREEQYQKERPEPTGAPGGQVAKPEPGGKVTPISGMDDVKAMIKRHEGNGLPGKPGQAYKDSVGKWTVGYGHLIGDGSSPGPYANRILSQSEMDELFEEDFAKHVKIAEKTPGWNLANESGKAAMIDLAFNMGYWWKKWPNTSKALTEGNFDAAADGLRDSKWYTQVGNRAVEVVALMKSGKGTVGGDMQLNTAVAEAPTGSGEQIGPKPKPAATTSPQVAVVVPPASPTGGNAGGKKPVSKPDPNQVQQMYAQGLGMPGTA